MEEYYFLFVIGFLYVLFAIVQDMKSREVSNWANFSFISLGLGYLAFLSVSNWAWEYFVFGLVGFGVMYIFSLALYYCRAFGGGDAKLLMGFGTVFPYGGFNEIWIYCIAFILLVFLAGFVWSLVWSLFVVYKNRKDFLVEVKKEIKRWKFFLLLLLILAVLCFVFVKGMPGNYFGALLIILGILWVYVKALDRVMFILKKPKELQEGDWIHKTIRVNGKKIEKTVHGLNRREIEFLIKNFKGKIRVKDGVPFTPAFLGALVIMVFFFEALLAFVF